jgi:hypothetical protein
MGGIAAYQLLSFYPDEFAGAVIWAGTKPGDTDAWLAGARWVPALFVHAPTDEVVTYEWSLTSARTLEGYGYEVELASPAGEHEYQAVTDDYRLPVDWFQGRRSVVDPPRVTYTRYPALDRPELGLKADGAYWVDDVAATGAIGTIDVTSSALAKTLPGTAPIGPETTDGPLGPVLLTGQRYTWPGTPVPVANALQAKLTGVSGFTIDAARAGLDPTAALRITVESDGPATVTLRGGCVERLTFPAGATEQTVPACAKPLGLPSTKRCASRRHFLIRLPRGKLRSVVVSVNGKRARVLRGRRVRSRVDLRGLPAGRVTVTIRARTRAGRLIRQTRRYLTCAR